MSADPVGDPSKSLILEALRGLRNGIEYGVKIRGTHSLVMILLFRRDQNAQANIKWLLNNIREHSTSLGGFVFLYKVVKGVLMRYLSFDDGRSSLVAGLIGGYLIWGKDRSPLHYQIVLYLLSRIFMGTLQHLADSEVVPQIQGYRSLATIVWGIVMYLYAVDPDCLQGSLKSSMDFLYCNGIKPVKSGAAESPFGFLAPFIPFSKV